jgi:gluconate 5-dehydrogenase
MIAAGRLFDLTGRVALVTGGSRGLGEEMAAGLAEAGAALMLVARREQWLQPAVERFRGSGFRCEGTICDVADRDSVEAAVGRTLQCFGQIDILINNAGISWGTPAEDMPIEKWREVLDVDLTGAFLVAQAAAREMLRRGHGNIINVASVAGLRAMPESLHAAGYSAAKGGLIALTRELACKWASRGIRVNAIAPGFFPSRMSERVLEKFQPEIESRIPMGRIGRAGELKGVAVFLASDASAYITGQTLVVDGGATAI